MIKNIIFKGLLPVLVLGGGIVVAYYYFSEPHQAKARPKAPQQAYVVETTRVSIGNYPVQVEAMGVVKAAAQIELKAKVGGEVVHTANGYLPGGFFAANTTILEIDPADYRLDVQQQQANLLQAQADYRLEMGRQAVAKNELQVLAETTGQPLENPGLALREPQLAKASAELAKAQTALDVAQLSLQRTKVITPFNALVTERFASKGDRISAQDKLATLVNTDEYWIQLALPVHRLPWLIIPRRSGDKASSAQVILPDGRGRRDGQLLRVVGTLDTQSRLADVLVSVADPLLFETKAQDNDEFPLILGDYVSVVLEGRTLENVVQIAASWLHDANHVWVLNNEALEIRQVSVTYEDPTHVYIDAGLQDGDLIVTSDIPVPVVGMKLRSAQANSGNKGSDSASSSATAPEKGRR